MHGSRRCAGKTPVSAEAQGHGVHPAALIAAATLAMQLPGSPGMIGRR